MPFTLTMPKLSPTMESGVIAKWLKKVGDKVNAGDVLFEVSTDKATVEHTALDEGYLRKVLLEEGVEAFVNQPIAIFTEEPTESIEGYIPEGVTSSAPIALPVAASTPPVSSKPASAARVVASPLAKKLAQQQGIDLRQIQGSGPRGRIIAKDLQKQPVSSPPVASGTIEEVVLSPIRKVISLRLQEAKSTIPHFYVEQAIDAEALLQFREQLSRAEIKVSINDCIVRACALALKDHPVVNSGFNPANQTIIQYKTIDICVAVSIEGGLITPIVKQADHKSIREISTEIRALAAKAREGKLAPHEFQGGSFTISNLGMYGVTRFQAIINPPQAAILAVGGVQDEPVVKNGIILPGKRLYLTLSADHRVVDGVAGAIFLGTLKKYLENPISLISV